jgi:hypothetical protein
MRRSSSNSTWPDCWTLRNPEAPLDVKDELSMSIFCHDKAVLKNLTPSPRLSAKSCNRHSPLRFSFICSASTKTNSSGSIRDARSSCSYVVRFFALIGFPSITAIGSCSSSPFAAAIRLISSSRATSKLLAKDLKACTIRSRSISPAPVARNRICRASRVERTTDSVNR